MPGTIAALGDFLRETVADTAPEPRDAALEMLSSAGIVTKGVKIGSPEYVTLLSETDWAQVQDAITKQHEAQQARSERYQIGIKDAVATRPDELTDVPEEKWADPVNWNLAMGDEIAAAKAVEYWEDEEHRKAYDPDEQKVVGRRIRRIAREYDRAHQDFTEQDKRQERSGIVAKSFYSEQATPDDDSAIEPTAYADFTNYALRIDTPEALTQTQTEWAAIKRFSPELYDDSEQKLVEQAIEHAAKRFEKATVSPTTSQNQRDSTSASSTHKPTPTPATGGENVDGQKGPDMHACPSCGKSIAMNAETCPFCGKDVEDAADGGSDEATEDAKKSFEAEARQAAEALIAAYGSGEKDAVLEATKAATLVSHQVAGRQKELHLTEVQGILEHALQMGGVCPTCAITSPRSAAKSADPNTTPVNSTLQRERDEAVAALDRVKAAGTEHDSALEAAKEAVEDVEQENEELRLALMSEKAAKATLQTEYETLSQRVTEFERRYPRRPAVTHKSVSVGTPGTMPRSSAIAEPELPPQTFHEAQARKRAGDTNGS